MSAMKKHRNAIKKRHQAPKHTKHNPLDKSPFLIPVSIFQKSPEWFINNFDPFHLHFMKEDILESIVLEPLKDQIQQLIVMDDPNRYNILLKIRDTLQSILLRTQSTKVLELLNKFSECDFLLNKYYRQYYKGTRVLRYEPDILDRMLNVEKRVCCKKEQVRQALRKDVEGDYQFYVTMHMIFFESRQVVTTDNNVKSVIYMFCPDKYMKYMKFRCLYLEYFRTYGDVSAKRGKIMPKFTRGFKKYIEIISREQYIEKNDNIVPKFTRSIRKYIEEQMVGHSNENLHAEESYQEDVSDDELELGITFDVKGEISKYEAILRLSHTVQNNQLMYLFPLYQQQQNAIFESEKYQYIKELHKMATGSYDFHNIFNMPEILKQLKQTETCKLCYEPESICIVCQQCGLQICQKCFMQLVKDKMQPSCTCEALFTITQIQQYGKTYRQLFKQDLIEKLFASAKTKIEERAHEIQKQKIRKQLLINAENQHSKYIMKLRKSNTEVLKDLGSNIHKIFVHVDIIQYLYGLLNNGIAKLLLDNIQIFSFLASYHVSQQAFKKVKYCLNPLLQHSEIIHPTINFDLQQEMSIGMFAAFLRKIFISAIVFLDKIDKTQNKEQLIEKSILRYRTFVTLLRDVDNDQQFYKKILQPSRFSKYAIAQLIDQINNIDIENNRLANIRFSLNNIQIGDTIENIFSRFNTSVDVYQAKCIELEREYYNNTSDAIFAQLLQQHNIERVHTQRDIFKFICKCKNNNCAGFICKNTGKCNNCNNMYCVKCLEEIWEQGTLRQQEHKCRQEDVELVQYILEKCRLCPNTRCNEVIHRAFGCDQMFCIMCNTAFDWSTGKIITNGIHNPHYFEWLEKQREVLRPLQHQDMEILCEVSDMELYQIYQKLSLNKQDLLFEQHFKDVEYEMLLGNRKELSVMANILNCSIKFLEYRIRNPGIDELINRLQDNQNKKNYKKKKSRSNRDCKIVNFDIMNVEQIYKDEKQINTFKQQLWNQYKCNEFQEQLVQIQNQQMILIRHACIQFLLTREKAIVESCYKLLIKNNDEIRILCQQYKYKCPIQDIVSNEIKILTL